MIGQSLGFYQWLQPLMSRHFPHQAFDPDAVYQSATRVTSGSIRIFSDELSYNLHIILRFEMELALLEKRISVADAAGEWEKLSEQYLGIRPSDNAQGILQDAHWAGGAFGYFPSYTLGNLYAASLFNELRVCVPDLEQHIAAGNFTLILKFLHDRIHQMGHLYETPELLHKAVGARDHVQDLLCYLEERYVNV
jgi:carboxypeptidase Taq